MNESMLIKQAFKLGNSAGVLVPAEWKGRKVAVRLIEKSISQEIIEILEERNLLKNTMGIYLAGSYARGEETEKSDIDILVITDNTNKQIKIGKYEIVLVSRERFDKFIKNSLYFASLINEAKAILNNELLDSYKYKAREINIRRSFEDIKSVTKINEKSIEIDEELGEKIIDGVIYSLVLRLREIYLIECLKSNKKPSNKEFINLINKIASEESYRAYLRVKNDLKDKKAIPPEEARALLNEIKKRIKRLEHG